MSDVQPLVVAVRPKAVINFQTTRECACWVNKTDPSKTVYSMLSQFLFYATMPTAQVVIQQFRNNSAMSLLWPRPAYRFLRIQVGTSRAIWHLFESTRKYALCSRDAIMNIEHIIIIFSLSIVCRKSFHLLICFHLNRAVRVLVRTLKKIVEYYLVLEKTVIFHPFTICFRSGDCDLTWPMTNFIT